MSDNCCCQIEMETVQFLKETRMRIWFFTLIVLVCASLTCRGDQASDLAGKGMIALKQNKFNVAQDYFTQALKANTNYLGAYYFRAMSYLGTTQYDKAIADLSQALQLNTNYADAYYLRGSCYMDEKEYDKSVADLSSALLLTTNTEIILYRAYVYTCLTNYNASIDDYTRAVHLSPTNARAYLGRARVYLLQGAYGLAILDCNAVLQMNPYSATAYRVRGEADKEEKDYDDAIADYGKALLINPEDNSTYYSRAIAFAGKEDYSNAVADCTTYLALNPRDAMAYSDRSWYRTELGDYSGAIDDGRKTIALDDTFFWGYNNLGWLLAVCPEARFRDGRKALEYAMKACALSGWKEPDCIDTLAAAYAEQGNFKEAIKWEKKALEGLTGDNLASGQKALNLYKQKKPYREELKKK